MSDCCWGPYEQGQKQALGFLHTRPCKVELSYPLFVLGKYGLQDQTMCAVHPRPYPHPPTHVFFFFFEVVLRNTLKDKISQSGCCRSLTFTKGTLEVWIKTKKSGLINKIKDKLKYFEHSGFSVFSQLPPSMLLNK